MALSDLLFISVFQDRLNIVMLLMSNIDVSWLNKEFPASLHSLLMLFLQSVLETEELWGHICSMLQIKLISNFCQRFYTTQKTH